MFQAGVKRIIPIENKERYDQCVFSRGLCLKNVDRLENSLFFLQDDRQRPALEKFLQNAKDDLDSYETALRENTTDFSSLLEDKLPCKFNNMLHSDAYKFPMDKIE